MSSDGLRIIPLKDELAHDFYAEMYRVERLSTRTLANLPFGVDWKAEKKEISKWRDFQGYENNFNREFFSYKEPRSLKEIDKELAAVESRILAMLKEVTE